MAKPLNYIMHHNLKSFDVVGKKDNVVTEEEPRERRSIRQGEAQFAPFQCFNEAAL